MSKMKVKANDKASGNSIDGIISKVALVPFSTEAHILFLDESGFACAKLGGDYVELRKFATKLIETLNLVEASTGVLQ